MTSARVIPLLTFLAISVFPALVSATSEELPAINITIQFRERGIFHIFRALEAAAKESGLKCTPTMEEYAGGEIRNEDDKPITRPRQMLCVMDPSGAIQATTLGDGERGQIRLRVYYEVPRIPTSIVKSKIDALVVNMEDTLKVDPLVESIENTVNGEDRPVTSKIK